MDFLAAAGLLFGTRYYARDVDRPGEQRQLVVGPLPKEAVPARWSGPLCTVVYTMRAGAQGAPRCRIISAREEHEQMNGERTTRMSEEEVKNRLAAGEDRTDYERLGRLTDEEIEQAIRDDPRRAPPLDAEWFRTAQFVAPGGAKEKISIRIDEDVLAFFRAGGRGYQSRINDVLRAYVLARRIGASGPEAREDDAAPGEEDHS